mmetsp:Transcript_42554/g.90508  ORF Transcript_42554/g.90508 Transcript_42554/m.90508 type:complete len:208 (+) Transcript_42554:585-1208(+)
MGGEGISEHQQRRRADRDEGLAQARDAQVSAVASPPVPRFLLRRAQGRIQRAEEEAGRALPPRRIRGEVDGDCVHARAGAVLRVREASRRAQPLRLEVRLAPQRGGEAAGEEQADEAEAGGEAGEEPGQARGGARDPRQRRRVAADADGRGGASVVEGRVPAAEEIDRLRVRLRGDRVRAHGQTGQVAGAPRRYRRQGVDCRGWSLG